MFIHQHDNWPNFCWEQSKIALLLDDCAREQGRLLGRLATLGFDSKLNTMAENMVHDLVQSSEIEGITLNPDDVRSSIAKHLGIADALCRASSRHIDGIVAVMLDAVEHYDQPLTAAKLCAWQSVFFPTGFSSGHPIEVGKFRTHAEHVVSGVLGHERVHYIAPAPERVPQELHRFIDWFNGPQSTSAIISSAIAHLWLVTIHPFEDGNGRLARILGEVMLARADGSPLRFYNMSSVINQDKRHYYDVLEHTQRGNGDITEWLEWYLMKLKISLQQAQATISRVLAKSWFWMRARAVPLTERQVATLNRFLDGYEAKITTKRWAEMNKCSTDTANRDIRDLEQKGLLVKDTPGAKRPSYSIVYSDSDDLADRFSQVAVAEDEGTWWLTALLDGTTQVSEQVSALDAQRFTSGDLPEQHLLSKYCSHLIKK